MRQHRLAVSTAAGDPAFQASADDYRRAPEPRISSESRDRGVHRLRASLCVLGVAILGLSAACGDDGASNDNFPKSSDPSGPVPAAQLQPVNAVVAGAEWVVGHNNFVLGITNGKDEPQGGAVVQATFFDIRDPANPKAMFGASGVQSAPGVGPAVQHQHASGENHPHGGQDDGRVGYYFDVDFPHAGQWGVAVNATLKDGTTGISRVAFLVAEKSEIASPGQKAPLSNNLIASDVKDIRQIDSGNPPNDMHKVRIKDAVAAGRPLVVVFATPSYCTSRFCGPVVEEIEALHDEFKDRVDFVHIEIWEDFGSQKLNSTVPEWIAHPDGSLSEPFVYVVDRSGVIYDRWEGPAAANILRRAVEDVAGGKLYPGG